ncbi:MAG: hypothetical protein GEU96_15050 [Propionibacteriales bacterium]|nr:hypothetical protein [Propionibacteriales bacterium]
MRPGLVAVLAAGVVAAAIVAPVNAVLDKGNPDWDDRTGALDAGAFAEPPSTSRPHAFWFWNGELTEAELSRQLDEMQGNGVEEFFIHPRQGLGGEFGETENDYYLSTDYFDKVGFVLEEARRQGMKAWLYDDLNWPSGFAGGRTVRGGVVDGRQVGADPTFVPWYLTPVAHDVAGGTTYDAPVSAVDRDGPVDDELVAAVAYRKTGTDSCVTDGQARGVALDGASAVEVRSQDGRLRWEAPGGDWCLLEMVQRPLLNYHPDLEPDEPYVDMLNPDVTQKFIDITHETYAGRFGEHFGSTIQGIFNDEPGFYNNFPDNRGGQDSRGSVAWTPGFRDYLTDNAGHDVTVDLAALWYDTGVDTTRTRVDYHDALSDRYNEAHTEPLADWAEDHDIALISNPLVEEDLGSHRLIEGGSWFEMSKHYQLPGMDLISGLNTGAITPKLNSSVAHLFQRPRNLAETFGAFGWDLTMEEMKRTVAWEAAGGVDLIDNHAFYYSIEGGRAFESQPSEFFQNLFWPRFDEYAQLVGRLMEPARGATPVNPVGVLYPSSSVMATGTPWDVRGFAGNGSALGPVDTSWKATSNALLGAQLDFDYLDELALAGDEDLDVDLQVSDGDLALGKQRWEALVLPRTTVLSLAAVRTMERLAASGGTVVAVDGLATREASGRDAELESRLRDLFGTDPEAPTESRKQHGDGLAAFLGDRGDLAPLLRERVEPGVTLTPDNQSVRVRHVRRAADDAYLMVNLSGDRVRTRAVLDGQGAPEIWDPETGETRKAPVWARRGRHTEVGLDLEPFGVQWVVFRRSSGSGIQTPHLTATNADSVESVREVGDGLTATVTVDEPGDVYALGAFDGRSYGAQTSVDGLPGPVDLDGDWGFAFDGGETTQRPLGSWTDLDPRYSGLATYTKSFEVPASLLADGQRVRLDLGDVNELAAVSVNGEPAEHLDWSPYVLDVTDRLTPGTNTVEVTVTNTQTNEIEGNARASGLLGPVRLTTARELELSLAEDADVFAYEFSVSPDRVAVQPGASASLTTTLEGVAPGELGGEVTVAVPDGWAVPSSLRLAARSDGDPVTVHEQVEVAAPADAAEGTYPVTVTFAGDDGRSVEHTVQVTVANAFAAWEFDIDGDTEGWGSGNQVSTPVAAGGRLSFEATGGDPYIVGPQVDIPLSGGVTVEVVMATSTAASGQLFWATTEGGFSEGRSGRFDVVAGDPQTYRIPIPATGASLRQLRLDPLTGTGEVSIDAIRVLPSG